MILEVTGGDTREMTNAVRHVMIEDLGLSSGKVDSLFIFEDYGDLIEVSCDQSSNEYFYAEDVLMEVANYMEDTWYDWNFTIL